MPSPDNGVYIIVGEMNMVMTAMKKSSRWSSHVHQDEGQDSLLKSFADLKDILNQVAAIGDLEPITYLTPFLDVIRAENTTGPVTGLGLSAVSKFLSYGLIDAKHCTAPVAAENIADAVTHARFMGTDSASDEVVLMKILHVLRLLLLTPLGVLLTNESVCEIMQSCFRICFETRLSELLRRSAEHSLMDMVQLLFSCLPQFTEDSRCAHIKKLKMRSGILDTGRSSSKKRSPRVRLKKYLYADNVLKDVGQQVEMNSNGHQNGCPIPSQSDAEQLHRTMEEQLSCSPTDDSKCPDMMTTVIHSSEYLNPKGDDDDDDNDDDPVVKKVKEWVDVNQDSDTHMNTEEVQSSEKTADSPVTPYSVDLACPRRGSGSSVVLPDSSSLENEANMPCKLNDSIELSSESGSVYADALEETGINHDNLDYINPRGVRFTPHKQPKEGIGPLVPYGLPCVRELFRYLVCLVNPHDRHNSETMIQVGLNLITVALEAGADNLGRFASFLTLIRDETCRNLFALLSTERLTVFTAALRVSFLLFEALRTHLKFQLEMFLKQLIETIVTESLKISYEQKEISLDCVAQLWRIPGLVTELYINYDCDLYCSNLFEDLTKMLSKNAYPVSGLYSVHLLSLEALLAVIENIESHCQYRMISENQFLQSRNLCETDQDVNSVIDSSKRGVLQQGASGYLLGQELISSQSQEEKNLTAFMKDCEKQRPLMLPNRMKISLDIIPSHEMLMAVKHKKKILITGTEQFNAQPSKGISFLQEHGLLREPLDPQEAATFLRDNPQLDKKMIGEYISNRKNLKVLEAFVRSFVFEGTRIDEALRQYLETFRLPGEAPLISLIMEHFAEHWHKSNSEPFFNSDAAFTLAYAIIMLNVDQHNHNVKKQNIPMTIEDFKKNLKGVNGGKDFDQNLLEEIYSSIKNEEIVMPAEQTGVVRENYLWKVLLRRGGDSREGKFIHTPNGLFDHDLFSLIWGPTVAALSFIFDKSSDQAIVEKTIGGFRKCAMIAAYYGMSDVFDNLIISLCKFSSLTNTLETPKMLSLSFGTNPKAQLATKAMFRLAHHHGDILREGWKNILDCVLQLYKASLLPKELVEAEDFVHPKGMVSLVREDTPTATRPDTGLFSSFYSYITLTSSDSPQRQSTQEDDVARQAAVNCISECHCEQLFTESKFLRVDSLQELVKTLIFVCHLPNPSVGGAFDQDSTVFLLELLVKIVLLNRDRVLSIWTIVRDHLLNLIVTSADSDYTFLLERSVVGILRIAIRLIRKEEMIPQVLQSLKVLLYLRPSALYAVSRQISHALHELLRTNAANIHSCSDWSLIFSLLERVGAGTKPPRDLSTSNSPESPSKVLHSGAQSDSELSLGRHGLESGCSSVAERGYTSDSGIYEVQPDSPQSQHQHPPHQLNLLHMPTQGDVTWVNINSETENLLPLHVNQYNIVLHRELLPHNSYAFLKSCESLAFLVRDVAHITTENFESCVHCIRTFVEASTNGGNAHDRKVKMKFHKEKERKVKGGSTPKRKEERSSRLSRSVVSKVSEGYEADDEDKTDEFTLAYQQVSLQLLDLMHTLHTRASSIYRENVGQVNLWNSCWCPLLQGIARLCCDSRRAIRTAALTLLPRALLVHDLQTLSPLEWESCFNKVLFPLLAKLLENINPNDHQGMEETRMRGATLLCKVFLQHLSPLLSVPTFMALWLTILEFMDKYMHADGSDLLAEAVPESLKNMLLVMDTAGVFECPEDGSGSVEKCQMWHITWDRINIFLPGLKDELFKQSVPLKTVEEQDQVLPDCKGSGSTEKASSESVLVESVPVCTPASLPQPDDGHLGTTTTVSVILHPPASPIFCSAPNSSCITVPVSIASQTLSSSPPVPIPLLLEPVMTQTEMPIFTSHQAIQRDGTPSTR